MATWRTKTLITRKFKWITKEGLRYTKKSLQNGLGCCWRPFDNQWWVRKYESMSCGCVRNPLTRRMVIYRWRCPEHMREMDILNGKEETT